jgi:hypothetical protein
MRCRSRGGSRKDAKPARGDLFDELSEASLQLTLIAPPGLTLKMSAERPR